MSLLTDSYILNNDVGSSTPLPVKGEALVSRLRTPAKGYSATDALLHFYETLTDYEKHEVLTFQKIYYTGTLMQKVPFDVDKGFDDSRGSYRFVLNDHLGYRYQVIRMLGSGSFGQVFKCYDHKRHLNVAVKMVRNYAKVSRSAQIELELLSILNKSTERGSANIIRIVNFFEFRGHKCVVFELMGPSLYDLLKKLKFTGLPVRQVKEIANAVLLALEFLAKHKIMHCDLKPENILFIKDDCHKVKLIDFGSACHVNNTMYTYIQSRFYRAPEVLMQASFGLPIDMWSFGCIIAELLTGTPIFPGEDKFDQMTVIMEILGTPTREFCHTGHMSQDYFRDCGQPRYCRRKKDIHDTVILVPEKSPKGNQRGLPGSKPLPNILKSCPQLVEFLKNCLCYDPSKRYTPGQAYNDPWLCTPIEVITIDDDCD